MCSRQFGENGCVEYSSSSNGSLLLTLFNRSLRDIKDKDIKNHRHHH